MSCTSVAHLWKLCLTSKALFLLNNTALIIKITVLYFLDNNYLYTKKYTLDMLNSPYALRTSYEFLN